VRSSLRHVCVVLSGLLSACGSKSGLLEPGASVTPGSSGTGGAISSGGASSSGGTSAGGGGAAGGSGGFVEPSCFLSPSGEPEELLSFPEGDTDTPLMAVLDKGTNGSGARVAYAAISEDANFWHPELRIAELGASSTSAELTKDPVLYGFDAHAWGRMVHAPAPSKDVALAFYHSDEASPNVVPAFKFRSFDPNAWQPGPEISVDALGTVAYGFAAGASVSLGNFAGAGYAACYRALLEDGSAEPRVAVLDANGTTTLGPVTVSTATTYPGRSSDVCWSGVSYLLVTSFGECDPGASGCFAHEVTVSNLEPSGQLPLMAVYSPLDAAAVPYRSTIASNETSTWIVWSEALPDPPDAPRTVRLARLDAQGNAMGEPIVLATDAHPSHSVSLAVTDFGVVVWWGEPGDPALPEYTPGHSRLIVHHYTGTGVLAQPPFELPATSFAYGLPPGLVTLDASIGALASWGALSETNGKDVTWLARLRCVPEP
jgi:hypothetical protein